MKRFTISFFIAIVLIINTINAQWVEVDSGYENPWILYSMSFPPGQNDIGFIAGMYTTYDGDGVILKTEDGGQTWTTNYGGTSGTIDGLQAICFIDEDKGFAGGWNNYFIKTTDGGDTWTDVTVGTGIWYFTDIEFWDEDNGVACAWTTDGGQPVWITDDGGDSWTRATSGLTQLPFDITYADVNTLYVAGNGGSVFRSTDGGDTWSSIHSAGGLLFGVDFEGTQFGVVAAEEKMLATTDGGSTWSSNVTGYENFWAVKAFSGDSAYVAGTDERIWKTIDGGASWSIDFAGQPVSTLYKFSYTQNNTGFVCGSSGKIFYREAPLSANFEADQTTVCTGASVTFTDMSTGASSWSWTFEGGTPSSSTDQNPVVIYNTPGVYDVELEVSDGAGTETEIKYDYISVIETPGQADQPDGEELVCTDQAYTYTIGEVDYAGEYEWEITPSDAGTYEEDGTTLSLYTADDWTGDFTIRVRATNQCGDGDWSDYLECTLNQSPDVFTLEGGGGFCLGEDGVEITLNGSQNDVDYELYLDGVATGNIVSGTGSEISFGLVTDEGYYTCSASNDNCDQMMMEQVHVSVLFPPLEPDTPAGPEMVCNNEISDYESEGTEDADSYVWELSPEDAGTITANGLTATVEWNNDFSGTAYVSLYGINDCGNGNPSTELEVSVNAIPSPVIIGPDEVCDNTAEIYSVAQNETSTFNWELVGGSITEGQGTNSVTIAWGEAGDGSVSVTEETENGCTGTSEVFEVFIDDCTSIDEYESNQIKVYPNPVDKMLNISFTIQTDKYVKVMIFNQSGQKMIDLRHDVSSIKNLRVNISEFPSGIYFIQVHGSKGLIAGQRFIKK